MCHPNKAITIKPQNPEKRAAFTFHFSHPSIHPTRLSSMHPFIHHVVLSSSPIYSRFARFHFRRLSDLPLLTRLQGIRVFFCSIDSPSDPRRMQSPPHPSQPTHICTTSLPPSSSPLWHTTLQAEKVGWEGPWRMRKP